MVLAELYGGLGPWQRFPLPGTLDATPYNIIPVQPRGATQQKEIKWATEATNEDEGRGG